MEKANTDNKEYKELSVKFSNRLRDLIDMVYEYKQEPVSYKVVAQEMDIKPQSLSHYTSSSRLPRLDICIKMIDYFSKNLKNFNPDYLLLRSNVMFKDNIEKDKNAPNFSERAFRHMRRIGNLRYSSNETIEKMFESYEFIQIVRHIQELLRNIKDIEIPRLLEFQDKYSDKDFNPNDRNLQLDIRPFSTTYVEKGGNKHLMLNYKVRIAIIHTELDNFLRTFFNEYIKSSFEQNIKELEKKKDSLFYVYDNTGHEKIEHAITIKADSLNYIKFLSDNCFKE